MRNYPLYIVIALIISLLFIFFFLVPKYKDFVFIKQENTKILAELQSHQEYFEQLQGITEKIILNSQNLLTMEVALPEKSSLTKIFGFFQKTASFSGLVLEDISSESGFLAERKNIKVTRIKLSLGGSYASLKNFLSVIEKSARLIEIDNISFSSPTKESFDFNVEIKVHSY